jgi:hypothetical protein
MQRSQLAVILKNADGDITKYVEDDEFFALLAIFKATLNGRLNKECTDKVVRYLAIEYIMDPMKLEPGPRMDRFQLGLRGRLTPACVKLVMFHTLHDVILSMLFCCKSCSMKWEFGRFAELEVVVTGITNYEPNLTFARGKFEWTHRFLLEWSRGIKLTTTDNETITYDFGNFKCSTREDVHQCNSKLLAFYKSIGLSQVV